MKKCKNCAKEFTPVYSTLQQVCSLDCAIEYENNKKQVQAKKKVGSSKTARQLAIDAADRWFSRYIRCKYAINAKEAVCYTSGRVKKLTELDNGHYISRRNITTRWHKDNARPQSVSQNKYHSGNQAEFRERLISEIGEEKVLELEKLAKESEKVGISEMKKIATEYRKKTNYIVKQKNIEKWW